MNLSDVAFARARAFLLTTARPLERARFRHVFEGGPLEDVLDALAAFQNPDGGFGRALEPDLRSPTSSALATGHGLAILRELGAPPGHRLVTGAVDWLAANRNPLTLTWRVTPPDVNRYPHAPWWNDEGELERTFNDFRVLPRASLITSLLHFVPAPRPAWMIETIESTLQAVLAADWLGAGGGSDLEDSLALAESPALPAETRARLLRMLEPVVQARVSRDPAQWSGYALEPLKLAARPDAPAAAWLADILPANLDHRIQSQAAEGAWHPTWSWFGQYDAEWPAAKVEWQGELTLQALQSLRAFGRLDA
jgi:hypothetical protein